MIHMENYTCCCLKEGRKEKTKVMVGGGMNLYKNQTHNSTHSPQKIYDVDIHHTHTHTHTHTHIHKSIETPCMDIQPHGLIHKDAYIVVIHMLIYPTLRFLWNQFKYHYQT
jgi:hypothetical protein